MNTQCNIDKTFKKINSSNRSLYSLLVLVFIVLFLPLNSSAMPSIAILESTEALGGNGRFAYTATPVIEQATGDTLSYTTTYEVLYIIKDHLGSIRVVLTSDGSIIERNDYYPFGLRTDQGRSYPTLSDRYSVKVPRLTQATGGTTSQTGYRATAPYTLQYNGKELQLLANTSLIDYGARQYNPTLIRWTAQDPLAEKYYEISPYVYCAGNPINMVDVNGEDWWDIIKGTLAALSDNVTLNISNIREKAGMNVTDTKDFNKGLQIGDIISVIAGNYEAKSGGGMIAAGVTTTAVGAVATVPTAGTSLIAVPIGGAEIVIGGVLVTHGSAMMTFGSKNLKEKKGHLGTDSNFSSPKGTQTTSSTIWRDKNGSRIDVENPNSTNRSGNIHYHSEGKKYMLNMGDGKFYSKNPKTGKWDIPAPNKVNKELSKIEIQKAINKGKKYIGYE